MFPIETAGSFQKINYTEFIRIDGMAKYGVWHDLTSNINYIGAYSNIPPLGKIGGVRSYVMYY